jgi:hypothetical protein
MFIIFLLIQNELYIQNSFKIFISNKKEYYTQKLYQKLIAE